MGLPFTNAAAIIVLARSGWQGRIVFIFQGLHFEPVRYSTLTVVVPGKYSNRGHQRNATTSGTHNDRNRWS